MIGRTLGHYRIHERIGAGGMGEVYRATDTNLGRDVALKVLPQDLAGDPERLARFEREARLLASLNHPNIAVVHGLESLEDIKVLAMELIPGNDLAERLTQGPLPQDEALDILRQVAEGLSAAHASGILHRDLKPANIKVTPEGVAKVIDFGLARSDPVASGSIDLSLSPTITHAATHSGVILGTAAYMSPEQARGKPVDRRADIFAFGAVLFEALTGHRVFAGETVSDTLAAILRAEPDWSALPARTAPRLRQLLERCLDKDPRQRLQDISEARIVLERVQAGDVGDARALPAEGSRVRWAWMVVGVFIAGVVLGRFFPRGEEPAPEQPLVRSEFRLHDPLTKNMRFSRDGRRLLYVDDDQLWIRDLDQFEPQPVPGSEGAQMAAWSPDGENLVFAQGVNLYRLPSRGGVRSKLATMPDAMHPFAGGVVWTVEDRILFVMGSSPLYWIPATGGDPQVLHDIPEGVEDYHHLALLPDGTSVVYSIHEPGSFTKIGLYREGEETVVFDDGHAIGWPVYAASGHLVYQRRDKGLWAVPFSLDDMQTTSPAFLVDATGVEADVSLDGTMAYVTSQENVPTHLVWFDLAGVPRDTLQLTERRQDAYMSLSPDGRYLTTSEEEDENEDIWIHDLRSPGTKRRLTHSAGRDYRPLFTVDGKNVVYAHGTSAADIEIRMRSIDGRGEPRTLTAGFAPSLSADGEWLVFQRAGKSFQMSLYFMRMDGSGEPQQLLGHPVSSLVNPVFSPDGHYVLYQNEDDANLHLVSFPDGENQWQVTNDGGQAQRWSPGSDDVFYINRGQVMRIRIETQAGVTIGLPQRVVEREAVQVRDVFVMPDNEGKRVLVQRAVDPRSGRPSMRLVQNWAKGAAQ